MSPILQDSKFEAILSSESDLEEGEILEVEYSSTKTLFEDGEIQDGNLSDFNGYKKEPTSCKITQIKGSSKRIFEKENRKLHEEKNGVACKRSRPKVFDISSSDGEYLSEVDRNRTGSDGKYRSPYKRDGSSENKTKQTCQNTKNSYGMVQDIMTQIDETLCRKSRCNYKRRKSKDADKSGRSRSRSRDSKIRSRYRRRSYSSGNSDSEDFYRKRTKPVCKRKRRREMQKTEKACAGEEGKSCDRGGGEEKQSKRDFDECRKKLLEKLSKEKCVGECSDIQEVEMVDATNTFVDEIASGNVEESSSSTTATKSATEPSNKRFMDSFYVTRDLSQVSDRLHGSENEDDDTELIKLRLLALTSNRKKKEIPAKDLEKTASDEKGKGSDEASSLDEEKEDLDRNELLLRAEALKTALLKKHQRRLNKNGPNKAKESADEGSKVKNEVNEVENNKNSIVEESVVKNSDSGHSEVQNRNSVNLSSEFTDESYDEKIAFSFKPKSVSKIPVSVPQIKSKEVIKTKNKIIDSNILLKKRLKRLRWRENKKIKKTKLYEKNLKENNSQMNLNVGKAEEEDEKLRSQLLNDMMKKKSGCILADALQTSNGRLPLIDENKSVADVATKISKSKINVTNKALPLPLVPKPEIERIIVHLGSESSDEDNEDADNGSLQNSDGSSLNAVSGEDCLSKGSRVPPISADYERSVDILLLQARQKAEGQLAQRNIAATPEAVYKHLPLSQRLEYMRLKQKIAEKETLKKKARAADQAPKQNPIRNDPVLTTCTNPPEDSVPKPCNEDVGKTAVVSSSRVVPSVKSDDAIKDEKERLPSKTETVQPEPLNLDKPEVAASSSSREETILRSGENCDAITDKKECLPSKTETVIVKPSNLDKPEVAAFNSSREEPLESRDAMTDKKESARSKTEAVKALLSSNGKPEVPLKNKSINANAGKTATTKNNQRNPTFNNNFVKRTLNGSLLLFGNRNASKKNVPPSTLSQQNQSNISRLKILLKDIKIEKTIEEKYEKEIQKLKGQLNFLEFKRKQQRLKIEKLAAESKKIYSTFQFSLKENGISNNKVKEKDKNGKDQIKDEKPQKFSGKPMDGKTKEKNEEKNESKFKSENEGIVSSSGISDLKEYKSPLQGFVSRTEDSKSKRIDPNAIMCQYDLLGKCNDEECTYQHYRTS